MTLYLTEIWGETEKLGTMMDTHTLIRDDHMCLTDYSEAKVLELRIILKRT